MKGANVEIVVKDGKAIFVVDLTGDLGRSASGKSDLIASAGGAIEHGDGARFSLNVFRKIKGGTA